MRYIVLDTDLHVEEHALRALELEILRVEVLVGVEVAEELRGIEAEKFDAICAHTLMYIETHTKKSDEEIQAEKQSGKASKGKGDITQKEVLDLTYQSKNLLFGSGRTCRRRIWSMLRYHLKTTLAGCLRSNVTHS
jgi:hypothetical protein